MFTFVSFLFGILIGTQVSKTEDSITPYKEPKEVSYPDCSNHCPKYEKADIDGDEIPETILTEYISMNRGAGYVSILRNNEILFDGPGGPGIDYVLDAENHTLNVSFIKEYEENQITPRTLTVQKIGKVDGEFKVVEETTIDVE